MKRVWLAYLLLVIGGCFFININAEAEKSNDTTLSFQGTIKSGVYDMINNQFGIRIELNEYPGKVFLLTAGSNAAKSMGTFVPNRKVFLGCRKGIPSDSSISSPKKTDIYHVIRFKYIR